MPEVLSCSVEPKCRDTLNRCCVILRVLSTYVYFLRAFSHTYLADVIVHNILIPSEYSMPSSASSRWHFGITQFLRGLNDCFLNMAGRAFGNVSLDPLDGIRVEFGGALDKFSLSLDSILDKGLGLSSLHKFTFFVMLLVLAFCDAS